LYLMRRIHILAVCVLLAGACASHRPDVPQLTVETFSGHVTTNPEGTWFTPCGSADAPWWVTYVDASVRQAQEAKTAGLLAGKRTFVRWRASRTDGRLAGPGGPALLVRDIFEVRGATSNDCGQ